MRRWNTIVIPTFKSGRINGTIVSGNHDPLKVGTGTGTAEEFRAPLGYNEASVGEPFLKIGVGILERAENVAYHFNYPYKMIETGKWKIKKERNSIQFIQELITDFGYAYRYEKIIRLKKDKPEIEIIHYLKNIGEKDIHANPYCHNFFQFDKEAIGTDYKIEFPESISTIDTFDSRAKIQENCLQLNIKMEGNEYVGGHIEPADAKEFVLMNEKTKTSVEVISDVILGPFYLYITKLSFCPEPMILFDIEPGESYNWSRIYRFYK